jgi:hypothetical protein
MRGPVKTLARAAGAGAAAVAAVGAGYVVVTWCRYGAAAAEEPSDPLLHRFLPAYEVRERHAVAVAAPLEKTWAALCALDLQRSPLVRAIFHARELLMGAGYAPRPAPRPFLEAAREMGWRELAEEPGREIVMGAVTRPWEADVTFRGLPPEEFATFAEPGYVKIAWTLAAAPRGASASLAVTETRVATTDAEARARFRRYWSLASPGILLIRRLALRMVKQDAERGRG